MTELPLNAAKALTWALQNEAQLSRERILSAHPEGRANVVFADEIAEFSALLEWLESAGLDCGIIYDEWLTREEIARLTAPEPEPFETDSRRARILEAARAVVEASDGAEAAIQALREALGEEYPEAG